MSMNGDIIHRDLKPANILVSSRDEIKIADFGAAHRNNARKKMDLGRWTPAYCAPELLGYDEPGVYLGRYGTKVDMWSVGCIFSEMLTYVAVPTRGRGSNPSEFHVIAELWTNIFFKGIKLASGCYHALWEMDHIFPQNSGKGSSRSDFSAVTVNAGGMATPFPLVEFEANGVEVHKDHLVVESEAALELTDIVVRMCRTEEDLAAVCIFVALVSDGSVSFRSLTPKVDDRGCGRIYFEEASCGRAFHLAHNNLTSRIVDAAELLAFLRGPVCAAGQRLEELAGQSDGTYSSLAEKLEDKYKQTPLGPRVQCLYCTGPAIDHPMGYGFAIVACT
ncbi:hypothetical protein HDU86_000698 [Geranomyces michiganensis]|nr:hypothetical protein HDU86_000698 [Geranomyces michiganensis]